MRHIPSLLLLGMVILAGCKVKAFYSKSDPITHEIWDDILKKHVTEEGWLDYQGVQRDSDQFKSYLKLLSDNHPNPDVWSRNERLAYWINAYNAFTVELILDNYPLESIKDIKKGIPFINGVWDIEFINIEGQEYSLNNLEHGIIRPKFNEPRIHFAVNCASFSCPVLRNEAFTARKLDEQLTDAAKTFLSDPLRNKVDPQYPKLSKIFTWFKGDFTNDGSLIEYVNQFTTTPIESNADVEFLDYDWALNDAAMQQK